MDKTLESPLEVLSRAASMVQETQQQEELEKQQQQQQQLQHQQQQLENEESLQQQPNNSSDELRKSPKSPSSQSTSGKWKRERRQRTEYARKSETLERRSPDAAVVVVVPALVGKPEIKHDAPLDMTVKARVTAGNAPRGLPPSYSQAISDPKYRSKKLSESSTSISMCDPIIDEHFRRSLGKDYNAVFSNNNSVLNVPKLSPPIASAPVASPPKKSSPTPAPVAPPQLSSEKMIELMDGAGMSVDDHFAKALGDAWLKLNNKTEPELST